MTAAKVRHLHPVPNAPGSDLASLQRRVAVLAERRAQLAYQRQGAEAAALDPDVVKDRAHLVARTAYCLKQRGADVTGLLTELATAMYVHGHMDAAAEDRPGLTDATLATIIRLEDIERKIRDEAMKTAEAGA